MVKYTVTCTCKRKRTYEAHSVGECIELAETDGWTRVGDMTARACKACVDADK